MHSIWQDTMVLGVPVAEKILRTVAVYVFLIGGLRLFGKRELGQLNPLDVIVLLLLSNTVQNAIIGNDNSLAGGLVGAVVLFVINYGLVRFAYRYPRARRLIEGRAEEVIRDGRVLTNALKRNFITREELQAAARKQGIEHLGDVECAHLEVSGAISFTPREPTEAERFHAVLLARLDTIEKRIAAIATGMLLFLALVPGTADAQVRPSTDVWVVPMTQAGHALTFGVPLNATHRTDWLAFVAEDKQVP